ncbi:MAG: hypothetical protein ACRDNP_08245 [Gaiellaceae bacterium]
MKTEERIEARRIRCEEGESIKRIARRLNASVSSVSLWVRDIELSAEQRAALRNKVSGGWSANAIAARRRRSESQAAGRRLAQRNDTLFVAGCMLFWAEGSRARNAAIFTNSDPAMVSYFARFLRECFAVPDDVLAGRYGSTSISVEQSIVNVYSKHSQKKRRNKLPYGTCRLVVCDTAIVQSIYGAIQEYAGFDRPEWLG